MGYAKVRSIRITDDSVFITSAENNIRPLYYTTDEFTRLSELLREKGRKAVEMELIYYFFCGSFQGRNKYVNAIKAAEAAGEIPDHYQQYLKCGDDPIYREQFLQKLHSYLFRRKTKTAPLQVQLKPQQQTLF